MPKVFGLKRQLFLRYLFTSVCRKLDFLMDRKLVSMKDFIGSYLKNIKPKLKRESNSYFLVQTYYTHFK